MKKIKILFVIFTLILSFNACKKENAIIESKIIDPTEQKILNFKDKLKSGNKSEETMTVDSAVWYIEAALNYTYSDVKASEVYKIDSIIIPIVLNEDEEVFFSDIQNMYNLFEDELTIIIAGNKVQLTDIEFISGINKSEAGALKATILVSNLLINPLVFGSTDYWDACFNGGKCGPYNGQQVGKDATTQLSYKANLSRSYPANGYITDINTIYFENNELEWIDFLWFEQGTGNPPVACLDPGDMNYWLGKVKLLASNYKPSGKEIAGYHVWWNAAPSTQTYFRFHNADISYGIFHSIGDPDL